MAVTSAVARDSASGNPIINGDGQINFTVVLADGWAIDGVPTIMGSYKNLKDISLETGIPNTYRITKVKSDLTITVNTYCCYHENVSNPVWTWASDYSSATLSVDCANCSQTLKYSADVSSALDEDGKTIIYTASYTLNGTEYTDTQSANAYTAQFITNGNAAINIYYTQDYTSADEMAVTSAVARDSASGSPVINGEGQINFTIVVADGWELDGEPVITGNYKNLKNVSTDDLPNTYRVTKVSGDLTITVSLKQTICTASGVITIAEDREGTSGTYGIGGISILDSEGNELAVSADDGSFEITLSKGVETTLTITGETTVDRTITITADEDISDLNIPIIICNYQKSSRSAEVINYKDVAIFVDYIDSDELYIYANLFAYDSVVNYKDTALFVDFISDEPITYIEWSQN
jgi:hypothetical protein